MHHNDISEYVWDRHWEKYKTSLKNSKEYLNKWKDVSCSCIESCNTTEMSSILQDNYNCNKILIKALKYIFLELEIFILQFIQKNKMPKITTKFLRKKKHGWEK